ncbi:MAG: class I SAM-dependent methyltransferase [Dehalococcoidia bacterium]
MRFESVPVFCNVLHDTREAATAAPQASVDLAICSSCSHIFNATFDPDLLAYSEGYENALHHSGTFIGYQEWLIEKLVREHGLCRRRIVEIGCGQGDFLSALCQAGKNTGIGFDPSYRGGATLPGVERIESRYFDAKDAADAEAVVCRQVLEHIESPAEFLSDLRDALGPGTLVAFEVPNGEWCFGAGGIWDVIYEHCGYFTPVSLTTLFANLGFLVREVTETFGGQFLLIVAHTGDVSEGRPSASSELHDSISWTRSSARAMLQAHEAWKEKVAALSASGPVVIWGAGSKGATFLNLADAARQIEFAVDLNPKKVGKHVPGTGQRVISPAQLVATNPGTVIVMNPNYESEIREQLRGLGLNSNVVVAADA